MLQDYAGEMISSMEAKRAGERKGGHRKHRHSGGPKIVPFFNENEEDVHVMIDYLKSLGEAKQMFFDNEISESFENRCFWASDRKNQHKHDYVEAFYLMKGEARQYIGGQSYPVSEQEFWIMNTSISHSIVLKDPDTLIMNILISRACYQKLITQVVDAENALYHFLLNETYEKEKRPEFLRYRIEKNSPAEEDFYRLLRENGAGKPFGNQIQQNLLTNVFLELSRIELIRAQDTRKVDRKGLDLFRLLEYISQNYNHATLSELSEQFFYSETYISNFLKKQTGMNFRNLICKMKLEKAREMLANTDWSVEKIAEAMNYSSRKHFEKSFQMLFQLTPSQYRKDLEKQRSGGTSLPLRG